MIDTRWYHTARQQVTPLSMSMPHCLTLGDTTILDTRWCHTAWHQMMSHCLTTGNSTVLDIRCHMTTGDTTVLDTRCYMTWQQMTPLCLNKPGNTTVPDTRWCHTPFGIIQANKFTVRWCHDVGELNNMMSWHGSHCHWTTQTLLFLYPLVSCDWALRLLAENKNNTVKL